MDLKEIALHLQDFRNVYVTGNPAMLRSRTDFLDIFSAYGLAADMSVSKKTGLLIVCSDPMQKKIAGTRSPRNVEWKANSVCG